MEPIRILHVLGTLNLGGAESRVMDLYRNIDRSRLQFDFLIHHKEQQHYEEEVKALGGRVYRLPRFKGYNYFSYRRAVKLFFRQHTEFHAVHGHMTSTAGIYLPLAKKQGVGMTIAHARSAGVDKGLKGKITQLFRRNLKNKTDYCFSCSALAGEAVFGKEAMEQGRVQILPNAIEASKYVFHQETRNKIRKELGIHNQLVIGHVGRFSFMKNHRQLLEVFQEYEKENPDTLLLLLGQGECMEEIRQLVKEKKLSDKVIFAGNKKNVNDYYQAMDCFVFPSLFEGLPGSVVEAQTAGLPCLISDTITQEVVLTPLVKSLSPQKSAGEWKEALVKLLQEKRAGEEGSRRRDSREAFSTVEAAGFHVLTQVERMTGFYKTGKKKKLLLMVPMLHQGGFERVCVLTARLLLPYYQVFICVFDLTDLAFDIEGIPVFHLNLGVKKGRLGKAVNVFLRSRKVRALKKRLRIDIAYSFGPTANLVNVLSGKVLKDGRRTVGNRRTRVWCGIRSYMDLDCGSRAMIKLFVKGSDQVISCSRQIEKELREGYHCKHIETLYNPYDSSLILQQADKGAKDLPFAGSRQPDGEGILTLVSMGREDDVKGFWHLIKAFWLVIKKQKDARMLIIGDGDFKEYKELSKQLGIEERVVFTGLKKNPYPYLALGSIYVLTSYYEGFPNALVEAMTLGLPVIATDCKTGPAEILGKQEYGILIPNLSPEKNLDPETISQEEENLAGEILSLWEDKSKYMHYAKKARERASEFNFDAYRNQMARMIDKE